MSRERLIQTIARHEGYRQHPYFDTVGKLTVGYGRNLDDVGVSAKEALYLLNRDVDEVMEELDERIPWWRSLNEDRQEVLINMAFNVGIHGLMGFRKMLAAAQRGDYLTASAEMKDSKWHGQVGKRARELEAVMLTGVTTQKNTPVA